MLLELIGYLLLVGLLGAILYINYKHWQYSHIPGPPRDSFIFGNGKLIAKSIKENGVFGVYQLEQVRKYGMYYVDWIMVQPKVFVSDPLVVKDMFTDRRRFVRPGGFDLIAKIGNTRLLGYHSIITDPGGPIWRHKKRVMDPAFSIPKLTLHLNKFQRIAQDVVGAMEKARAKNEMMDIRELFKPFTIDAISVAGFSADEETKTKLSGPENKGGHVTVLGESIQGTSKLQFLLNPSKRKLIQEAERNIQATRKLGADLIKTRTSDGTFKSREDVLDHLIEANMDSETGVFDLENALDDFLTMYFAGNATTLTTLGWSVAELIRNPAVQVRLVEEIDEIWGAADITPDTDPTRIGNILRDMKYLDAFVKEVLRIHPPVCFSGRRCVYPEKLGGYDIPAQTILQTSQYVMHRFERFWDAPDTLNPDRFLKGSPEPYTYFPFSFGPRQCMGKNFAILELKVILCEVLKRFELVKPEGTPDRIKSYQALLCVSIANDVIVKPRF